jgi:hypothetical protein
VLDSTLECFSPRKHTCTGCFLRAAFDRSSYRSLAAVELAPLDAGILIFFAIRRRLHQESTCSVQRTLEASSEGTAPEALGVLIRLPRTNQVGAAIRVADEGRGSHFSTVGSVRWTTGKTHITKLTARGVARRCRAEGDTSFAHLVRDRCHAHATIGRPTGRRTPARTTQTS